jgi:hypothetical protein
MTIASRPEEPKRSKNPGLEHHISDEGKVIDEAEMSLNDATPETAKAMPDTGVGSSIPPTSTENNSADNPSKSAQDANFPDKSSMSQSKILLIVFVLSVTSFFYRPLMSLNTNY